MSSYTETYSELAKAWANKQLYVKCGQAVIATRKSAMKRALMGQKFYASLFATDTALYINSVQLY